MCLTVAVGDRKRIANKDIQVYKVLTSSNTPPHRGGAAYETHKLYEITNGIDKDCNGSVNEGFHAYQTYRKARDNCSGSNRKVVTGIIPRGARFYIGTGGDIVSDKIMYIAFDDISR